MAECSPQIRPSLKKSVLACGGFDSLAGILEAVEILEAIDTGVEQGLSISNLEVVFRFRSHAECTVQHLGSAQLVNLVQNTVNATLGTTRLASWPCLSVPFLKSICSRPRGSAVIDLLYLPISTLPCSPYGMLVVPVRIPYTVRNYFNPGVPRVLVWVNCDLLSSLCVDQVVLNYSPDSIVSQ